MTFCRKNPVLYALNQLLKIRQNDIRLKNESIFARFFKTGTYNRSKNV